MSSNNENKIRKTLLTPCRRMGLKRKSLESIPNTSIIFSNSQSPYSSNTVVNKSLPESEAINMTPIRPDTENLVRVQVPKRLKICSPATNSITVLNQSESPSTLSSEANDQKEDDIDSLIQTINERISVKRKEIEKLELNSKNVKQHNLETLNSLIHKWRQGCQTALRDLFSEYQSRDESLTLTVILKQLSIPHKLVHYSETEMDFQN